MSEVNWDRDDADLRDDPPDEDWEKSTARGEAERDDPTEAPPLFEDEPNFEALDAFLADPRGCCEDGDDDMLTDQGSE